MILYIHLSTDRNGENMLSLIDLASFAVIIGSYAVIAIKIRSELRNSVDT